MRDANHANRYMIRTKTQAALMPLNIDMYSRKPPAIAPIRLLPSG